VYRGINLKLPLPGGQSWLLTTETGGYDCASIERDWFHTGNSFYSLDFAPVSQENGWQANVPVYAAADGKVRLTQYQSGGGYYIAMEHDQPYDDNLGTGFSTWYLHLQAPFMVAENDEVVQGQQIGVMGNSGDKTTGTHLHFGVRYGDRGEESVSQLERVRLEGLPLKEYLTECDGWLRTKYYPSTNTP
jgi:murein DD-endopeptidase MepM/ murein hydrolase activator NlpD